MKSVDFQPKGVCSTRIQFDLDGEVIRNLRFTGGCNGNLKAIGKLVEGKNAKEIAGILSGNICGMRQTSCADQLAKAITEAVA